MTLPAAELRCLSMASTRRQQLYWATSAARARAPAAKRPHVAAPVDRRDRQTDGRTPDRYTDAYRQDAGSGDDTLLKVDKRNNDGTCACSEGGRNVLRYSNAEYNKVVNEF